MVEMAGSGTLASNDKGGSAVARYNFVDLSDYEFEVLVRDLLQADLGINLVVFTPGRDRGIDIRHLAAPSIEDRPTLVIQCKKWQSTLWRQLLRQLEAEERPKVASLNPMHYMLATSVEMTPDRKDAIFKLFQKWMQSPDDVLGRDDLNNLLRKHPRVERSNFKLWLTSTTVLEAMLRSGVFTRTTDLVERT